MWYGKNDKEEDKPVSKKKEQEEKSRTQRYLNSDDNSEITSDEEDIRLKKTFDD